VKNIERRLTKLEESRTKINRKAVVVLATDEADRDRQVSHMFATGALVANDALVCITGRPAFSRRLPIERAPR
jgi:hypothetical protein